MKVLFVEALKKNLDIDLSEMKIASLPKELFLAYSIQYKDLATKIKLRLEANGISVKGFSQVLGCSNIDSKFPVLFIGSGKFHLINLFTQAPAIYIIGEGDIVRIPKEEIDRVLNKKGAAYLKFLNAEKIGILVSTKLGQENLKKALELKKILEKKQKKVFIFLGNNIDLNQFENFNIDSYVNTACVGLSIDNSNIINIEEIKL
jgi:diphthamide biosynthesis enzyme Dph1/Dph2-like protein